MRNTTVFFCDGNLIIFRKFRSYRDWSSKVSPPYIWHSSLIFYFGFFCF
jgi:hypothetical protein